MTPEQEQAIQEHIQGIAKILYENTPPEQLKTLAGIEQAVREQIQQHLKARRGSFFITAATGTTIGRSRTVKSILFDLTLTSGQAEQLGVESHTRLSPYLEMCCLRVSANVSYQHTEEDVEVFTGIRVSAKTQQRLVHRQTFRYLQKLRPALSPSP